MYKLLFILLLTACQLQVKHKGLDDAIPEKFESDSDVNFQPGFDKIKEYCTGKIDHEIEVAKREDPELEVSEEDRQFEIDDCYYNFDFSGLEALNEP